MKRQHHLDMSDAGRFVEQFVGRGLPFLLVGVVPSHVSDLMFASVPRILRQACRTCSHVNDASNPHTPAPLESDCREYLETISVLLTTPGYPILEPVREIRLAGPSDSSNAAETLLFREGGTEARARPTTEGLLVLAGSAGKAVARPSLPASVLRRRLT
jgi:hypothetical protein